MFYAIFTALLAILVPSCMLKLVRGLKSVDYLPGPRCFFSPLSLWGAILPTTTWNPGLNWPWLWRSFIYKRYKSETISVVPFLYGSPSIYTSSLEVAKQVLSGSGQYFKAPDSTAALLLWGDNVISSDHEVYKRHRRIVGPAFTSSIFSLVWEETSKTYHEMLEYEGWSSHGSVTIPSFNQYASKLALIIIARCGFGLPFSWEKSSASTDELSLDESLTVVSENVILRLATPSWLYKFPIKKLDKVELAYRTMARYMIRFVGQRRAQLANQLPCGDPEGPEYKADLFTRLVAANETEVRLALDDKELIGNTFAFLFAGHETTAHVISATLALLALHPEEQDNAVEEIRNVFSDGRDPVFHDSILLTKVLACFQEAARMFPAGAIVTRDTTEPVRITTPTDKGDRIVVLPPGMRVVVDMIGIHYNSRQFKDPELFRPSRWYAAQDADLSFFGLGPRACLGKRFAMTEALCFLTFILRDWILSPALEDNETHGQWKDRVLQGGLVGLAFGVKSVPLKLTRRL